MDNQFNQISSTPVAKPPGDSLVKRRTVSELIKKFEDRKPANGSNARQVSFFSTTNEATGDVIESKLDSVDSGYDSFLQRSRSGNSSSVNNASKAFLAKYEKFPNFKFSYLKYFGVDPKEYLSKFDINYDPVSDSIRKDSSDGEAIGVKISNSKYFAAESREEDNAKKNRPMKVENATDLSDYEDVFVTKVAAGRDVKNSQRSIGTQTCSDKKFQSVDAYGVTLCDKAPPKRPSEQDVDRDLISRIQPSIKCWFWGLLAVLFMLYLYRMNEKATLF